MPTTNARIRSRFRDLVSGGMAFVTERIRATESFQPPAFEDMTNADATDSSIAVSTGTTPAGIWWHSESESQWFAGTRITTAIDREDVGSQETYTAIEIGIPDGMEIDVWMAQVSVVDGNDQDVEIQLYNADTDTVLYSHSYADHGPFPSFDFPVGVFGVAGDVLEVRVENHDPGSVEVSGMIEWSYQTVLD